MPVERPAALLGSLALVVAGSLLYLLAPILTPFVAAAILAYICNPLVNRATALGCPRTLSTLLVMLALAILALLFALTLLPLLQREAELLMQRMPDLLEQVRARWLPWLQATLGISLDWDAAALKSLIASHWQGASGMAQKILPWLSGKGSALLELLMNLLLIPLAMFYLLRDWPHLLDHLDQLIPRRWHGRSSLILREADLVLSEFLRGQLSVMLLMSLYYSVALQLTGLQFSLPIGLAAGMLVFVPYLGMLLGLGLATLAAFSQFDAFTSVLWVWAAFGAGQLLEGMAITPWLVGERIGLHPLAVIFALLAFGQLFGFFGVLLALPLSAVLLVLLRHARSGYMESRLYKDPA